MYYSQTTCYCTSCNKNDPDNCSNIDSRGTWIKYTFKLLENTNLSYHIEDEKEIEEDSDEIMHYSQEIVDLDENSESKENRNCPMLRCQSQNCFKMVSYRLYRFSNSRISN